jgi:hypothetical protein
MAGTTIVDNAVISSSTATQSAFRLSTGPLALLVDYDNDSPSSSTNIVVTIEFSPSTTPDVDTDTDWYTPATEDGTANNTVTITETGRKIIDISTKGVGTTLGAMVFRNAPTGVQWCRVSVISTTGDTNASTVTLLHSPPVQSYTT